MQNAVQKFPEQQFDVPSPYLDLQIKTDGRTYVKPEKTTEETTESTGFERTSSERTSFEPAPRYASPAPQPVPQPAPSEGPRRRAPARDASPVRGERR